MKGSQKRGWNTGRLMSIMSDCPSVLCLWPAGLISQSCHYCSVSVHWNSTSTFTVGNTHLSSGFLRAALKKKRKHFEYPVCAVLLLLLLTIFLTDRGLAAFISQYFIILVLFILRDFYFIVRHVFTLRCLQYVKYKGDLFSDLWKPLCVCYRGVERLFQWSSLPAPLFHTHVSTHSNITQPPLMYLCWYFVNNKRRKKSSAMGFLCFA